MADSQFAMFAVHTKQHQATVTFQARCVVVRIGQVKVRFPNPKPEVGRQRWQACKKHAGLLVKLAYQSITRHRIEQEERELARMKDHRF